MAEFWCKPSLCEQPPHPRATYWILISGNSITRVNVKLSGQNSYLSRSYLKNFKGSKFKLSVLLPAKFPQHKQVDLPYYWVISCFMFCYPFGGRKYPFSIWAAKWFAQDFSYGLSYRVGGFSIIYSAYQIKKLSKRVCIIKKSSPICENSIFCPSELSSALQARHSLQLFLQ